MTDNHSNEEPEPENDRFKLINDEIEVEVQSAQKYYENKLYHLSLRRYDGALQLFQHLPPVERELLSTLYFQIELHRAIIFLHLGNPYKVIDICTALNQKGDTLSPEISLDLEQILGTAHYLADHFEEAIRLLNRAELEYANILQNDKSRATLLKAGKLLKVNALAHVYKISLDKGMSKLYMARELFLDSQTPLQVAECDVHLGELCLYFQELRSARFHITTAYSVFVNSGSKAKLGFCLWLYARLERISGNANRAVELYREAMQNYQEQSLFRPVFLILVERAQFYVQLGDSERAEESLLEAEDLSQHLDNSYHEKIFLKLKQLEIMVKTTSSQFDIRKGYRDLIRALRDQSITNILHYLILRMFILEADGGDLMLAEELVHETENFWQSFKSNSYPLTPVMNATIALKKGNPSEAEKILIQAHSQYKNKNLEQFLCLMALKIALLQSGELNSPVLAHDYFRKAINLMEGDLMLFKTPFHRDIFFHFFGDAHNEYVAYIISLEHYKLLFEISERKLLSDQKRAFGCDISQRLLPSSLSLNQQNRWQEMVALSKKILHFEGSFEFCNPYDFQREPLIHEHEDLLHIGPGKEKCFDTNAEDIYAERKSLYDRFAQIKAEIMGEDPRWQNIFNIQSLELDKIVPDLDRRTVILMFIVGHKKVYGIMINQTGIFYTYEVALSRTQLSDLVNEYNLSISEGKNSAKASTRLWIYLVKPFYENISDKIDRLVIVPHDVLWKLPFHLLKKSGQYLWDRFLIEYSPSVTMYAAVKNEGATRRRKQFRCLTLMVPGISEQLSDLVNLEHIIKDKKSVDDITLISESLTRKKFWQNADKSNIIIIGTKLTLFDKYPMASFFELAPVEFYNFEVSITLDDIMEKKFSETDLVIFPSVSNKQDADSPHCAHALLYRSWFHAGVPTLIYSPWPSDPVAVSLFIQMFLQHKTKMSLAQALRQAAFSLRNTGDFTVIRDWAPLSMIGYGGFIGQETKMKFFSRSRS
ncbi:CHAT domain-containing protein [candidate division CSSED10-310 bacterium]|uniref:CHAT domain-containing protein n=1 Tax=candidate division CSSED10-310 bacterium TaxID=2855610 RepID=A0ABV6YQW7_UNCC1